MRFRVTLVLVVSITLAQPANGAGVASYWPVSKLMRAIDGKPVSVEGRRVRVDAETTLCAGRLAPRRVRGVRAWRSFACTYTTFTRKGVDRDLDFRVRTLDGKRFKITDAHWVAATR
jgi:hypothetical protein